MQQVARLCPFKSHTAVACPFMQRWGESATPAESIHLSFKRFSQEMLLVDQTKYHLSSVRLLANGNIVTQIVHHRLTLCVRCRCIQHVWHAESKECKRNTEELRSINLGRGRPLVRNWKRYILLILMTYLH